MKLRDFGVLGDENIQCDVRAYLHQAGFDVLSAGEAGSSGAEDRVLLHPAVYTLGIRSAMRIANDGAAI